MSADLDLDGFDLEPETTPRKPEKAKGPRPGKIYTFYSFKGGVGRSMALANIAVLVAAQGKRVLLVDFDLEAPGLEHFFLKHDPGLADRLARTPGVIDLLGPTMIDWRSACAPIEVRLQPLSLSIVQGGDAARSDLDIMHSGHASRPRADYTDQVQRLNWAELYKTHNIGTRFGHLRAEWIAEYDYVFIDSRTGVTDIGDLCTVVLPDHLVMLFVTNAQNIEGIASIYQRAVTEHRRLPFERSRLTVLPVLSRDEFYSENRLSQEWRGRAAERLSDLFADWLPEDLRPIDAFQKIFIPYFAIWSFGEALPVLDQPDAASNPSSINASYSRIARLILHDLDWSSLDQTADPAEVTSTRIIQRRELEEERRRLEEELAREREQISRTAAAGRLNSRIANLAVLFVLVAAGYFGWTYFTGEDLTAELARLEEQKIAAEREGRTYLDELTRLNQELQQARSELVATTSAATAYDTDLEKTRVELRNARNDVEQLRARLATLEGQNRTLSGAQGEAGALREQLEVARAENRRTTEQYLESAKNNEQCRLALQQSDDRFDDYMMRVQAELTRAVSGESCQSDVQYLLRLIEQ